jgi:phospholipase C
MTTRLLEVALVLILLSPLHAVSASPSPRTPIQHVIIIVQENHSFDNYFGTYPTANGTRLDPTTSQLSQVNGLPNHTCLPIMSSCISPNLSTNPDQSNPVEGQPTYELDYANNGTGFATYSGPQSMVYFDYRTVAGYWDYAEEYGLADNYYAPVLSTTTPNRLMILAGDTPVSANYGPPPRMPYSSTLMQQLDDAAVSWGYYDYIDIFGGPSNVYPLNYTSDEPQQALSNTRNISDLIQELSSGSGLPSVSFVNSLGLPNLTEHPPFNPRTGEQWVVSIVNRVMESNYWASTAIFITWDEGGGFYDHVVPPREFTVNHAFTDELFGLGQRVPLLVISPYSKENFVSSKLLSHLSLLHFVEYNWNLPLLNGLVGESNLPLDFFNFSQGPRNPVILSSPIVYPIPLQTESAPLPISIDQYGPLLSVLMVSLIVVLALELRRFSLDRDRRESRIPQEQKQPPRTTQMDWNCLAGPSL